ncbi:hypothetical protein [Demequina rhizosphaerae]|uniref:hypothetical protein n=1 Tax=Demequina rhizosphaerae TaxID=1638985 RepID=UPI000786385E|nr:hypothetical protein [Demequina rhizosphaerae]
MFSYMVQTLVVGGLIAAIVFVAAFASEGRGRRVVRILLGAEERRPVREHLFDEIERPESTLDVVGELGRETTSLPIVTMRAPHQPARHRA